MRVLVIDDSETDRCLVKAILVEAGYEVETACDAAQGMDIIRRGSCRLVISDWEMKGMSGIELCKAIRSEELLGYVYIILLTGHDKPQEKLHGLTAGADDFIAKPFNVEELLIRVKTGERILTAGLAELRSEISERRRAEELLKARTEQQAVIAELGQRALMGVDLASLMNEAVERVAQTLNTEFCKVLKLLPGGKSLLLTAGIGWRRGLVGTATVSAGIDSQAGYTLVSHAAVIVENLPSETRFQGPALLHEHGVLSGITVIIPGREGPFGVLGAHTRYRNVFTAQDIQFLQSIAHVLATAIERKQAESAMRNSAQRYRSLVSATSQAVWSTNADGKIIEDLPSWRAFSGQTELQQLGNGWLDALHPDDRERTAQRWNQAVSSGEPYENQLRLLAPDGSWRDVMARGVPVRDDDGAIREWVGTCTDITEQKRMERVRAVFEAIVQSSDDAIISKTLDGIIRSWNPAAERMFGFTAQEAIGKPVEMLIPPDRADEGPQILAHLLRGERIVHFETVRLRKDGKSVNISATISPIKDGDGKVVGASKIARDVTESKLVQASLLEHQRELERNNQQLAELYQTAQRFVDNVSHEFRTPLTVIKGYAEVVREGMAGPVNDQQREFLEFILDRSRDLAQMVDDLLDSSKLRAGTLRIDRRSHRIEQILEKVRPMIAAKGSANKVGLTEDISRTLPEIFVDAEKIGRIIVNLAVNAIKFSPQDSRITIWAKETACGLVEIGITDYGAGISPENLRVIFDRFKQVGDAQNGTTKGFGLGLNIARELAALNLGEINVISTLGQGSTFSFTVPPNDTAILLQQYMSYLDALPATDNMLCLLRVAATSADGITDEMRGLLASIVRPTELFLDMPEPGSLLLIGCTSNVERWVEELREATETSLQGAVEIEQLASCHYPGEKTSMEMKVFEEMRMEPAHV